MSAHELLVRVYIDGEVAVEEWLSNDDAQIDAAIERHLPIIKAADDAGSQWLVEIKNPDAPESSAYVRFGTDPRGMVNPRAVAFEW